MGKKQQFPDPEAVAECEAEGEFARQLLAQTRAAEIHWVKVEDEESFRALHDGMGADWYTVLPGDVTVGIHLHFQACYCSHRHCSLVLHRPGSSYAIIGGTGDLGNTAIVRELADLPVFTLPLPPPPMPHLKVSEVLEGV